MKVLQLTTKAYAAGVIINQAGVCVEAAPILKWMVGKGEKWIRHHCTKHQINIQVAGDSSSYDKELTNPREYNNY